ncbi:IS630 family transposase, partial [Microbacterium sp.]|uniref:IS630 family transposase n=1 Tax=Microbacterium sp. TaxID=51671 RepID=UPI0039E41719
MANSPAPALVLRDGDRDELASWTRSTAIRAGLAQRARIVLLASEGFANARIAVEVGTTTTSVWKWRNRYAEAGLGGLADAPRAGRPKQVDDERIITATLQAPPKKFGVTHWSPRLLADHLKIGNATVARAWRRYGVQPWRSETFKFSTDPELVGKVTDVVGLYLAPPENAIVLCVDEKSQIQALDRTAPMLPLRPGDAEKRTHDYKRHGTTTLFAALEIATGHVTGAVKPKHRRQEFLAFLRQL